MDSDDADDPPDGGGNLNVPNRSGDVSQPLFSQTPRTAHKRPAPDDVDRIKSKSVSPPSASSQTFFTLPGFDKDSKIKYSSFDKAPFSVQVSKMEDIHSPGSTVSALKVAQLLHKNLIPGIVQAGIK